MCDGKIGRKGRFPLFNFLDTTRNQYTQCVEVLLTQQNSYSTSHLQGTVTTQWLDSDGVITVVNCRQHGNYLDDQTEFCCVQDFPQGSVSFKWINPLGLRGYCTSYQKLACFVLYLKIINNFLKNKVCIL